MAIKTHDFQKILIVNLGGIGDLLLSTPGLQAIKDRYKESSIDFLGVARTCDLARRLNIFERAIEFPYHDETHRRFDFSRVNSIFSVLADLKAAQYDLAVNMRTIVSWTSAMKMALVFSMIKPRVSAGRDTSGRGFFFDLKVPEPSIGDKHETFYDLETARLLGADIFHRSFDPDLLSPSEDGVWSRLVKQGILSEQEPFVVINPGGLRSRRWPLSQYRALIDGLRQYHAYKIVVTGSEPERELSRRLRLAGEDFVIDVAGQTSIFELAGLLRRCALFVTNDTGPMHIGAILQIPMVVIFGGGYLARYDPRFISSKAVVFSHPAACTPCNKTECERLLCLTPISADHVLAAALKILA